MRALLVVLLLAGCDDAAAPADLAVPDAGIPDAADGGLLVPRIDEPWWPVTHNPDLGAYETPGQEDVDFGLWQAADGSWQLWECIRGTSVGGNGRLFYHWQGAHLTDTDWTPLGIAMTADPSLGETAGGLQAPFTLRASDGFHLFYGDWEHICQATSSDGKAFTRLILDGGVTGMFTEGLGDNTRDPMVLRIGDTYYLYDSAFPGGHDGVFLRTSKDLVNWSASTLVAEGGAAGNGLFSAECPFVVARGGWYYLFRTQAYGANAQTRVYRSADPTSFGVNDDRDLVALLPVAAPEIVEVAGDTYIAALNPGLDGIRIAHLSWVVQ